MFNMRGNGTASSRAAERPTSEKTLPPALPYGAPRKPGPHQLGAATLTNLDELTSVSADEIERVADRLEDGAREIADSLRAAAHGVRQNGLLANDRLANFVRVANTCADAARLMQASIARRDDPVPPRDDVAPPRNNYIEPTDLDALATRIGDKPAH